MAKREKILYADINVRQSGILSKFLSKHSKGSEYNPKDIELLRTIFSNQKMRLLYTLKQKKPDSIYKLATILKRDFKSVYKDLKLLERFDFIEFHSKKKGKRESLVPVLKVDEVKILISI